MESHNNQKKIAVINDMTGFGRCALTVAIPVISAMRVQCCPIPTAILSNHTAFESCFIDDYTDKMEAYVAQWEKLGLRFDGIYSGFLSSKEQIGIVERFILRFRDSMTQVIIDPVLGDHGKTYRTITPQICEAMKSLVCHGDILTPNVTEACILTDTAYKEDWSETALEALAQKLCALGPRKIVLTGIETEGGSALGNYCYADGRGKLLTVPKAGHSRCGTGDLFASIIAADAVNAVPFTASVQRAAGFVAEAIKASDRLEIPVTDGVCFEECLWQLAKER